MIKIKFIFLLLLSLEIFGESYYPKYKASDYGVDQGNYSSCESDALVNSLENAFLQRGMPVKLSNFYTHRYFWHKNNNKIDQELFESQNDADTFKKYGRILPYYMLPENGGYLNKRDSGKILTIEESAIIHPNWKSVEAEYSFISNNYTFERFKDPNKGYSNEGDLKKLKNAVENNLAVYLSIHGRELIGSFFNKNTGILHRVSEVDESANKFNFTYQKFNDLVKKNDNNIYETDHAISVIGYDDNFYEPKSDWGLNSSGAIFVKNSWNDKSYIQLCSDNSNCSSSQLQDLTKFRAKVADVNIPGFYAIPYDLIEGYLNHKDTSNDTHGVGGYKIISLNFEKFYIDYLKFKNEIDVLFVPYKCDRRESYGDDEFSSKSDFFQLELRNIYHMSKLYKNDSNNRNAKVALNKYRQRILNQASYFTSSNSKLDFYLAQIPFSKSLENGDKVLKSFFGEKLLGFYCKDSVEKVEGVSYHIYPNFDFWKNRTDKILHKIKIDPHDISVWTDFYNNLISFHYN